MLRCSKHRARLELAIDGFADHRLTNLATDARKCIVLFSFQGSGASSNNRVKTI